MWVEEFVDPEWDRIKKTLDWVTDQVPALKEWKDAGKAINRFRKDIKDSEGRRERTRKDWEEKARPILDRMEQLDQDAREGMLKNELQQYEDMGLNIDSRPSKQP